ncbi:hypothetical protein CFOL_v3_14857 [Cephalotus follicularis]|uniref:Uncharacterized protein n=1 Tax=Cephalotus follicularis TaxID=3775 RepID=A0A1Q3BUC8_CEPFO|nr:hypothetical protein CFOL_v3_14857 [Cephalotus follicularis]
MESDLSLLEMSMEDDSLLQNDDVSGLNNTFFACSPLEIPRSKPPASRSILSPMEGVKGNEDAARPSSSSHSDSANKENIFMNKLEVSKLTLEPQQMKRKKKVGGYNLRKSLAWDRAFFTEEGVLNSFELSIISGELNKSSGAMLPIIHEDGSESLSGNVDCSSHSQGLQALEETLFQEFPKHASPSRNNTTPASAAKRKVLAAHDLNRSGSKRNGCPRPVASSSYPFDIDLSVFLKLIQPNKGSKVSKIPVSKAGPCATSKTSAMQGANQSKRNQIAQLGVDAQKNIGVKSPSNNHKSALKKSNSGEVCQPLAKSYAQQARRYVVRSCTSSSDLITQTNHGVKMKPGQVLPAPPHGQNGHKNGTSKIAVTPPQTDSSVCGNMRTAQLQTSKPSGLRMPSPSLGFFGQSKVSDLHGLLPTSTPQSNQSNFSVPDARKPGAPNPVHVKPPLAPGKLPKVLNDGTRSGKRRVAGTGMGCSISSTFNYSSDEKMKSDLHVMNMQKVEVKLPHSPNSCEVINNEQMLPSVCNDFGPQSSEHAETCNDEKIHHVDDQELQNNDKKLLLQSECREHLKKSDDERSANVCPESIDLIGSEMENFYSFDDNLQAESGKSILSSSVVDNYQPTKFENFCLPAEQVFHDNCELLLNDCLMHGERFSSEDSQQKNVPLNSNSVVPKKTDACGSELASSSALCLLPPANQDCGSDVAVMAECLHMMDALSGSVDDKNLQGNALQSFKSIIPEKIDACFIIPAKQGCGSDRDEIVKCLHVKDTLTGSADIEERVEKFNYAVDTYDTQYSQATSLESERMGKEQLLSPAVQVNGGSGLSDRIEHNDVEEKPYDSHCSIFVIQSEHDISYRKLGASDVDSDRLSVAHVVNKESIEHVKLITSRSLEADKPSREEEWSPKVYYDPLFEERSGKFNVGNIVDACPEAKCSCASEHELAEVANEVAAANTSFMEDAKMQKKSDNDKKQKTLLMEPPPHAVPFSEEWLAALEAAGEEILTRKSGAVQHSPPDKSLPEPSPWSPVKKKKNQGIGPYDCTKFTNTNILPSSSS